MAWTRHLLSNQRKALATLHIFVPRVWTITATSMFLQNFLARSLAPPPRSRHQHLPVDQLQYCSLCPFTRRRREGIPTKAPPPLRCLLQGPLRRLTLSSAASAATVARERRATATCGEATSPSNLKKLKEFLGRSFLVL